MKKFFAISLVLVGVLLVSFAASAQSQETSLEKVRCVDIFKNGSVRVEVLPQIDQTLAGAQATFRVKLINQNDFPILNGGVYVKIYQKQTDAKMAGLNGNFLVDQFFAKEGISLDGKGELGFDFLWTVPAWAPKGDYIISTYLTSKKSLPLTGDITSDTVTGGRASFSVSSEFAQSVYLNRNAVKVNGEAFGLAGQVVIAKAGEKAKVEIPVQNPATTNEKAEVSFELYAGDNSDSARKLDTKNETLTLAPKKSGVVTYEISDERYSSYYLVVSSRWNDYKSVVNIPVFREGISQPRISFLGVNKFPINSGESGKVLVCLGDNELGASVNGTLEVSIVNSAGGEIGKFLYTGEAQGGVGFRADFSSIDSLGALTLKAVLSVDTKKVSEAEMAYDCNQINSEKCFQKTPEGPRKSYPVDPLMASLIVGGIVIVVVIIFVIRKITGKRGGGGAPPTSPQPYTDPYPGKTPPTTPSPSFSAGQTEAKTTREFTPGGPSAVRVLIFSLMALGMVWGVSAEAKSITNTIDNGLKTQSVDVGTYNINVSYDNDYEYTWHANAKDQSGNILIGDGEEVQGGTRITFYSNPSDFADGGINTLFWTDSSGTKHSGYWRSPFSYPYTSGHCRLADRLDTDTRFFLPLVSTIPGITVDTSAAEASGLLANCSEVASVSKTCTVTGSGDFSVKVVFGETGVSHYTNFKPVTSCQQLPTSEKIEAPDFNLNAPFESIDFSFKAVPPPIPPPQCSNGLDDDTDSKVDFPNDPGCTGPTDDDEVNPPPAECSDTLDNDGDKKIDHPNDPGCTGPTDNNEVDSTPPKCSDTLDNDGDSKVDFPTDPGCVDANDDDETDAPVNPPTGGGGYAIEKPTILGPNAGEKGKPYSFSAQSPAVEAVDKEYRYGFDWNRDGRVDFWTGYVNEGEPASAIFTWATVGTKTFGVKTQDSDRVESEWNFHAINISTDGTVLNCAPQVIKTPCTAVCGGGIRSVITIGSGCIPSSAVTEQCNIQPCAKDTIIIEVPPGG